MAMRFIFDRVEGARARNTVDSFEIVRRLTVTDLPVYATGTGYLALTAIIKDPQCPRLNQAFPDISTKAFLAEHVLAGFEKAKRRIEVDLVYRSVAADPGGSDLIIWTVEDAHVSSHILTAATAGGIQAISVWYKTGTSPQIDVKPNDAISKGGQVHKVEVSRVVRVTGRATRQQWMQARAKIRGARGRIHSDTWGGYPRGTWLFFGPHTRTIDRGNTYDISLEFAEAVKGWFPILTYRDERGELPDDIAAESMLRSLGPPAEGSMRRRNAVAMVSAYDETTFSDKFAFTPDQEPQP